MIKRVDKRDKYNEKYHVTKEKTESRSFECHMIVKKNITLSCWIACLRSQVTPVVMISVCFLEAKWKKIPS